METKKWRRYTNLYHCNGYNRKGLECISETGSMLGSKTFTSIKKQSLF